MFKLNQKSNICKYERFSEQSLLSLMHKCLQQVFGVLSDNPPIYHYWFEKIKVSFCHCQNVEGCQMQFCIVNYTSSTFF